MTEPRLTTHRRTVVRGAAWTAPVIGASMAAPAFAASPCTTTACPDISFGAVGAANSATAGNGWAFTSNGAANGWSNWTPSANPVGFQPSAPGVGGLPATAAAWFAATAEPDTDGRVLTLTQTGAPALTAGCSYTLKFGVVTFTSDGTTVRPLIVRAFAGPSTQIAQYTTAGVATAGYTNRGIQTFVLPTGTTGVVSFRFVFGNLGTHEDIKLYSPSISCA